jgi:peroxiredoxin
MFHAFLLTALFLAPPQSGGAPAKPAAAPQSDPKKDAERARELEFQYLLLCDQYSHSEVEWTDQMRLYSADPEKRKEVAAKHPVKQYWQRFEALANDGQGRALVWLAGHAENMFAERAEIVQHKLALFRKLIDEHASDSWAMETVVALSLQRLWLETKGVEDLLGDFVEKTRNRECAAGALARQMAILSGVVGKAEDQKKVDEIRERILREYPDTEAGRKLSGRPAGNEAAPLPGSPAPEFTGKDVDGAEISLAASRGKVVLLDFWGFWSPLSRSQLPHLRELLTRHAADPFVILGVDSDDDAARFRELSKEHGLGWRSVWEGGRNGPVAQLYRVRAFPTLFLIDARGLIRKSWVSVPSDKALDDEIALAIAAAKSGAK